MPEGEARTLAAGVPDDARARAQRAIRLMTGDTPPGRALDNVFENAASSQDVWAAVVGLAQRDREVRKALYDHPARRYLPKWFRSVAWERLKVKSKA